MDISKIRITVRKYSNKNVESEKVEKILEAGRWAPTAVNYQPQRIIVLDTPENLANVRELGFNLPSNYVLHTVGPIINGPLTQKSCAELASCYKSCLALAAEYDLKNIEKDAS
jgi:nitroreductase